MLVKTNTRLVAVQAVFQFFFSKNNIQTIADEFIKYRLVNDKEKKKYDKNFFSLLVNGVGRDYNPIKNLIDSKLKDRWSVDRMDQTTRAIISLGIFELMNFKQTPVKVIIDEYVSIGCLFLDSTNTGFINGVLDSVAKDLKRNKKTG